MTLIDMLPKSYRNSPETVEIEAAFQKQTDKLAAAAEDLLAQLNVDSATWGLDLWEKALGIVKDTEKSYDFRRSRVKSKLRSQGTATKAMILNLAKSFTNGTVEIIERPAEYGFDVKFTSIYGIPPNMDDLTAAIEEIKPAHLAYTYIFLFVHHLQLKAFTHAQLAAFTHKQIRNGEGLNLGTENS